MPKNCDNNALTQWDGIYKDLDACGVNEGYPPGSDGANAWEKSHPGAAVVDWAGRGENGPLYKSTTDSDDDLKPITSNRELAAALNDNNDNPGNLYLRRYIGWKEGDEEVPMEVIDCGIAMRDGKGDKMKLMDVYDWREMLMNT